ncbi:hypothetical protein XMD509_002416 [Marinobacterium sp. xm-d-509]|nr:hypothetical protein [Marinobacterium sp. xm-d-509]
MPPCVRDSDCKIRFVLWCLDRLTFGELEEALHIVCPLRVQERHLGVRTTTAIHIVWEVDRVVLGELPCHRDRAKDRDPLRNHAAVHVVNHVALLPIFSCDVFALFDTWRWCRDFLRVCCGQARDVHVHREDSVQHLDHHRVHPPAGVLHGIDRTKDSIDVAVLEFGQVVVLGILHEPVGLHVLGVVGTPDQA